MKVYIDRLDKLYSCSTKPQDNLLLIKKFLRKVKSEGKTLATQKTDCSGLTIFSSFFDKDFNNLDEEDIYCFFDYLEDHSFIRGGKTCKYSGSSIYTHKSVLRKFLQFINKPELASTIKGRNPSTKKLPEDLLTKSEIEQMLNATLTPRDSALLSTLYESGARKGELSSVRLKHVTFDNNGAVIILPEGKTGPRRIRLVYSASYLNTWVNLHHPTRENKDSFLFVSLRAPFPRLSNAGLYHQLQRVAERAGVTKRVNPHSFRHARATELAKALSDQQLKSFLGWTEGSCMASVYVHLSGKDIDDAILKMNGIETKGDSTDGLKVNRCPRCKELNPESLLHCGKCGMVLDVNYREPEDPKVKELERKFRRMLERQLKEAFDSLDKSLLDGGNTQENVDLEKEILTIGFRNDIGELSDEEANILTEKIIQKLTDMI